MFESFLKSIDESRKSKQFYSIANKIANDEKYSTIKNFFEVTNPDLMLNSLDILEKKVESPAYREYLFFKRAPLSSSNIDNSMSPLMYRLDFDKNLREQLAKGTEIDMILSVHITGVIMHFAKYCHEGNNFATEKVPDTLECFIQLLEVMYKVSLPIDELQDSVDLKQLRQYWALIKKYFKEFMFFTSDREKFFYSQDEINRLNNDIVFDFKIFAKAQGIKNFRPVDVELMTYYFERLFLEVYKRKRQIPNNYHLDNVKKGAELIASNFPSFTYNDSIDFMRLLACSKWIRDREGDILRYML